MEFVSVRLARLDSNYCWGRAEHRGKPPTNPQSLVVAAGLLSLQCYGMVALSV